MANPNIAQNDIIKLGTTSLIICLLMNIALTGFLVANTPTAYQSTTTTYNSNLLALLTTQTPTQIYCIQGDQTCTGDLTNVPAEDTNQFDKLQSLVNVGKLMLNVFIFIGMTPLMPMYLTSTLNHYITDTWINAIITFIGLMWTLLTIYAIVKFIFKK